MSSQPCCLLAECFGRAREIAPSPHAFSYIACPMLLSRKQHGCEDTELPAEEARCEYVIVLLEFLNFVILLFLQLRVTTNLHIFMLNLN